MLAYTAVLHTRDGGARSRGKLKVNNFIRLRRRFVDGQALLEVDDRGDAKAI